MGCGQSKIHLYPRKSKSKANGKKGGHVDSDAETDEDEGHFEEKSQNRDTEKSDEGEEQDPNNAQDPEEEVSVSLLRAKNLSLLQNQEISSSQQNFFRMLDQKIEEGPDYDSASETEIALEEARLNALVQHWESVSLTSASICSSASRSQQTTPVRQIAVKQLSSRIILPTAVPSHVLNAGDFLPHGALQAATQLSNSSPMSRLAPAQQQLLLAQMNTMNSKMLQQMASTSQQIPLNLETEQIGNNTSTAANSSNSHSLIGHVPLQAPPQLHYTHMMTTLPQLQLQPQPSQPLGTTQILPTPNVSPRRINTADGRLIMNPLAAAAAQQIQLQSQQIQGQYMVSTAIPPPGSAYILDGTQTSSATVAAIPMLTCFTNAQQNSSLSEQQNQQQHQQQHQPTPVPISSIPQGQGQQYYGDVMHSIQATPQPPPTEYRFPPAISVQRLAPQVQRQLRETQELIKDSCPLYAAGYGSPGPPKRDQPNRNPANRRPTLETQFSQELS